MGRPRKNSSDESVRNDRPKRKSFDEQRNTISFKDQDPNYVYRIFNDTEGRLEKAELAGYEYVRGDAPVGDPTVDSASALGSVISKPVGGGKTGVLMRIKREWYDEDQKEKRRKIKETEDALSNKAREDGHYGGISIDKRSV